MSFIGDLFTGGPQRQAASNDATLAGTENQLLGTDITSMNQRNNIVSSLFPKFLSNVSGINPGALNQVISQLGALAPIAEQYISNASPTLADALKSLSVVPGQIQQGQQDVNEMSPEIQTFADQLLQFMNLGSPYYQQAQRSSFEQGSNQFNNLAGQLRQMIDQSGQGDAPSGLQAASMGDLIRNAGSTLSQNYLSNLFQNENMQLGATNTFAQVPQLKGTQANLQTALAGAQTGLGTAQSGVAGQQIGQGLGEAQVGQGILGTEGALKQSQISDQIQKAGLLSPIPALPQVPRSPSMAPTNGSGQESGIGGLLGGIGGLIGAL